MTARVVAGSLAFGTTLAAALAASPAASPRPPERIYATTCGYCHGHNIGPVIRGRALPPEMIRMLVRGGIGAMPAFRPTEISDAELATLADWISTSDTDPKEHGR